MINKNIPQKPRIKNFNYSLSTTIEDVPVSAPILLRGDLFDIIQDAKKLGYDAVELQLRDAANINSIDLKKYCDEQGIAISALATGLEYSLSHLSMISDDENIRIKMQSKLKEHIDLAEKLGCLVVIGCARGNIPNNQPKERYLKYFQAAFIDLIKYAAVKGVIIVLEAVNNYINNYFNSVIETCDYIRGLHFDNLKIHIDTHHMNIEDYDPIESIRHCKGLIGYVHFSEINRMFPGAGKMDFKTIMEELSKVNYRGYISLECIPKPDGFTAAKNGLDYLKLLEGTAY